MKTIRILFVFSLLLFTSLCSYAEGLLSIKNITPKPFSLSSKHITTWKKEGVRVFLAEKDVRILQGQFQITADSAVCWFNEEEAAQHSVATVEVYCEGNVTILQEQNYENYAQVYLRFETMSGIVVNPDVQPIKTFEEPQENEVVSRGEDIRSRKEEEYLSLEIPKKGRSPQDTSKGEVVDIVADNIDSWIEKDKRIVVALGNVKIKKTGQTMEADSVILWFDQKDSKGSDYSGLPLTEMYAEGNVILRRKDDVQTADKIFESMKEDKGIFVNSQLKTKIQKQEKDKTEAISKTSLRSQKRKQAFLEGLPVYVKGEEIRHIGKGQYEIKNGAITTCGYGHPHYRFQGKKIRLIQRGDHNIVSSTHNSLYIDKYPVAYLPYLSLDVRKKERILKDWQFGSSSRFGTFLRTDWDLFAATGGKQKDWSDLTLNLDYMEKRGVGTGLDFEYQGKDLFGYVNTYYINEQGDYDIGHVPIEERDRGTILWRHRQELPYDLRMDLEYSYLSDPGFLKEYLPHEFKQEKDRETVLYLRRIHDTTAETFTVNEQLNGFDTTVDSLREKNYSERLPEVAYRILGEPIWENRLVFTSESTATHFDSTFNREKQTDSPPSLFRVDSVNQVSMPFKPGFFNVKPFVEGRTTGYTESVDSSDSSGSSDDQATGRFIGTVGLDVSSTHWRTYSVYNDLLKINRLRHVFVPELRYLHNPVVTEDPDNLYQYDNIDSLDASQTIVVGVKNVFQTKRGEPGLEKTIDFITFNADYYMFPADDGIYNDSINGIIIRKDNFVNLDFKCQLTDMVAFVSERNEFNTEEFQFDVLSSGVEVYNPPDWQYFVGHRHIRDISSTLILAADYRISEKWSVLAAEKYDFKSRIIDENDDDYDDEESNNRNLKTNFVLSRYFHDWVASLTLELDPVRDDSSYRFDITPKGLQKASRRLWF